MTVEEQKQIESDFIKKLLDGTIPITGTKNDLILGSFYFKKSNIFKSISGEIQTGTYGEMSMISLKFRTLLKFRTIDFEPEKKLGEELINFLQKKIKNEDEEIYREFSDF